MIQRYREATEEEEKAFLESEGKKEEQEAYQEKKYEKKKYIDEDGVWIPRIVKFLILMLLIWLAGNEYLGFDMFRYR